MAATASRARRPVKAVTRIAPTHPRRGLRGEFIAAATSAPAKAAYIAIGTAGLVALAVAIIGPKRVQRQLLAPLRSAVVPQAEKLWNEARPLREQIAGLFEQAGPAKERLAQRMQSWIGHFRAT